MFLNMKCFSRAGLLATAAALIFALGGCSSSDSASSQPLTVTIAHLNDTHSALEPTSQTFALNSTFGSNTQIQIGGVTRFKSAVDALRSKEQNVLLLHAGDAVQGTLYFTQYQGSADFDFLNLLGVDAMTLGNHEFDKGTKLTGDLVSQAKFPVVSANLDVSGDANLKGKVQPYTIKSFGSEKVGIIGLALTDTPNISSPGTNVKFNDPTASVNAAVSQLNAQGVNKIIVLSHMGYDDDMKLAKAVNGVGVIIGGHSHTLLGDPASYKSSGYSTSVPSSGDYPTVVKNPAGKNVLVAQAWEWFKILGSLKVTFDTDGSVQSYNGSPTLIVSDVISQRTSTTTPYTPLTVGSDAYKAAVASLPSAAKLFGEDPAFKAKLDGYAGPIQTLKTTKIASAANDMKRGDNVGPGPVIADAMVWKAKSLNLNTQIGIQNAGGVRTDILAGDITVGTVYTVLPFGNTLVVMELSGADVRNALEDGVGFQLGYDPPRTPPYMYVSGVSFNVTKSAPVGSRVSNVKVKDASGNFVTIDPSKTYRVVTNNYMAGGGDGYKTFNNTKGYKYDTGIVDAEAFMDYLKQVPGGTISNPTTSLIQVARAKIIRLFEYFVARKEQLGRHKTSAAVESKKAA
ncbi:MAG: bifunctional metallophosphatase/5'-nucleotidase [Desulfuromonadales bacterium]